MTDKEIKEKALKLYPDNDNLRQAFILGYKESKSEECKKTGWIARESDGSLWFFKKEPEKIKGVPGIYFISDDSDVEELPSDIFPEVTYDSDSNPIKVEISFNIKKV